MLKNIDLFTQNAIMIKVNEKTIYFDPYDLDPDFEPHDADIIFITHPHYDHFSPDDIRQIMNENTKFVCTPDVKEDIQGMGVSEERILTVEPFFDGYIDEFHFTTIPAYNIGKDYHKREYNWVSYIVDIEENKFYIAGDTDITPEAKEVKCDIAFVPIGGTYTMTAREAAELIKIIKPKKAIPTHYGTVVGSEEDREAFREYLVGITDVEIFI